MFEACRAAQARGNPVYIQLPCQPSRSTSPSPTPIPSSATTRSPKRRHTAPISLSPSSGAGNSATGFRASLANPRPGLIFQGNWNRVVVAVPALAKNEALADRTIDEIAAERGAEPLDVMLDLGLEENLETTFIGQFLNVGDEGVARLLRHDAGVVALSDAGAHLTFMCEAGYGLHFLARWVRGAWRVRPRGRGAAAHEPPCGSVRDPGPRADSRRAPGRTSSCSTRTPSASPRANGWRTSREAGSAPSAGRSESTVVFCNGVEVFDGADYVTNGGGPGGSGAPDRSWTGSLRPARSARGTPPPADPRRLSLPRDGGGSPPRRAMVSEMRRSSSAAGCDDVLAITIRSPDRRTRSGRTPRRRRPSGRRRAARTTCCGSGLPSREARERSHRRSRPPGRPPRGGRRSSRRERSAPRPAAAAAAPVDDELPDEGEVAEGGAHAAGGAGLPPGGRR